jgi:hypothetical protein
VSGEQRGAIESLPLSISRLGSFEPEQYEQTESLAKRLSTTRRRGEARPDGGKDETPVRAMATTTAASVGPPSPSPASLPTRVPLKRTWTSLARHAVGEHQSSSGSTSTHRAIARGFVANLLDGDLLQASDLQPSLEAAAHKHVEVSVAPEPEDVLWSNLEVTDAQRRHSVMITYAATLMIVIVAAVGNYMITITKLRGAEWLGIDDSSWLASTFRSGLSVMSSTFIAVVNLAIKAFVRESTHRERHVSTTRFERSLFSKLSIAYVLNTVALPWFLGAVPYGFSQGWYEAGGPVEQAQALIITSVLFEEGFKLTQPAALFRRYVLSRRARSQLRLNSLWDPPDMAQGEIFASVIKVLALVLLYAPLYPLFYLLGAFALLASFFSTKLALSFWWGRPPWVGAELMERLRNALALLLPPHFVTAFWAANRAQSGSASSLSASSLAPLVASAALWLILQLLRFRGVVRYLAGCALGSCCVVSSFYVAPYDELEATTDGIRYDDVPALKNYGIARYRGLAATKADEGSAGWSADDLEARWRRTEVPATGAGGFLSPKPAGVGASKASQIPTLQTLEA